MTAFIEYKDGGDAISTHTPLVRRDLAALDDAGLAVISTHTPLVRRDKATSDKAGAHHEFQLTRLL